MRYEIQTYTLCAGWINLWTEGLNTLVTFDSFEDAQKELQDFLGELANAVELGHLDDFSPDDYRIERIAP
jgi:hypothetical protein